MMLHGVSTCVSCLWLVVLLVWCLCALSWGVVMCCVWLSFNVFVWFVCGFACVVVWRVWFCDVVFSVCVACVRVVLV